MNGRPKSTVPATGAQAQPFWKGYLRLSLVTCPVALTPATSDEEKVRFHILNRATGDRVVNRFVDDVTGAPVANDDQARAYERGEADYVLLEDDDLEAVALDSVRTIDIETFAPLDSIDWIWCETPYFLTPDDPVGVEAYCVIRDAMRVERVAAISRLVLHRRERAVMLKARDKGVELWTLRFGEEVRDAKDYFPESSLDRQLDPELLRLVGEIIEERTQPWSETMVEDPVQSRLLELIAEKRKSAPRRPRPKPQAGAASSNVVSIMDALRNSVAAGKRDGQRPARPKR